MSGLFVLLVQGRPWVPMGPRCNNPSLCKLCYPLGTLLHACAWDAM